MHGEMTRRREGCVSAMLTESELSIAPPVCHFKESVRRNGRCKPTSTPCAGLFVLTMRPSEVPAREAGRSAAT